MCERGYTGDWLGQWEGGMQVNAIILKQKERLGKDVIITKRHTRSTLRL